MSNGNYPSKASNKDSTSVLALSKTYLWAYLESTDQYTDESGVPVPGCISATSLMNGTSLPTNSNSGHTSTRALHTHPVSALLRSLKPMQPCLVAAVKKLTRASLHRSFLEQFILACDYLKATVDNDAHGLEVLGTRFIQRR